MIKFDAISLVQPLAPVQAQCDAFRMALHDRRPDIVEIYNYIQSPYSGNIKPVEEGEDSGELAEFLNQYLVQVESFLCLISTCRGGFLAALENIIKYFFAHDLLNYARLMPVYLAQMNALEQEDPTTWEALKSGDFVVAKSEVPFTKCSLIRPLNRRLRI